MNNKPTDPNNGNNQNPNNLPQSPFFNKNAQRLWIVLGVVVLLMFIVIFGQPNNVPRSNRVTLDQLASRIEAGDVQAMVVRGGSDVIIELDNGTTLYYYKDPQTNLLLALQDVYGVTSEQLSAVEFAEQQGDNTSNLLLQLMIGIVPTVIIVWLLWRMMRSVRTGQDQAMSFGRSRARVVRDVERPQVTFCRCGRRGRGQAGTGGSRRVPERAGEVHPPGRAYSQGRADGRPPRDRQDADGARGGW